MRISDWSSDVCSSDLLDLDGKPIRGQRVQVALYNREIITARRRLIGGFYAYDNQMRTTKLAAHCSTSTDRPGRSACAMAPGVSGEVPVVATPTAPAGNEAPAAPSAWPARRHARWVGGATAHPKENSKAGC